MQDTIERKIVIKASKQRVFEAITDAKQLVSWFPDDIEGGLEAGESPLFGFGEHGKSQLYIVAKDPHDYFAFRWVPGGSDFRGDVQTVPNTLVEFRIEEAAGNTTVTMIESGFSGLPKEKGEESFGQNSEGWTFMLGRLEKHFAEAQ